MMCTRAASSICTTAAVLNSCNAARSSRTRRSRTTAADREYYDLFYSLLEEGRRDPRPALAAEEAGDGGQEAEPRCCCPLSPAWKIAIRSVIVAASLLAEAFLVSLLPLYKTGPDVFVWVASVVMIVIMAAMLWSLTLDCIMDPH